MQADPKYPEGFAPTDHGARIGEVEFIWARNSKEFLFSNSILVHGDKPVIIDPSASFTYIEQLAKAHYVRTVLNTHRHGDHRSLNQLFKGVVFAAHEADSPSISDYATYARESDREVNSYYANWTRDVFQKYKIVDCPVSLRLKEGDVIDTGSERIRILHIPGHTPGHIALFFEKADLLFTSDIDLTPYGPWYANVVSDIDAFKKSVARMRDFECRWYVPSHGERVYDREKFLEKIDRFAAAFHEREDKILALLRNESMEIDRLCSTGIVYRQASLIDPLKAYFQFQMVEKHLEDLEKRRLIQKDQNTYSAK